MKRSTAFEPHFESFGRPQPRVVVFNHFSVVIQLELFSRRHPEQSRFSGGSRDLARSATALHARSLGPLVKNAVL
jgi:hypothetical protein